MDVVTEADETKPVLTTRLFADGVLVRETTDQTVWAAVLNRIVANDRAGAGLAQMHEVIDDA